MKNLKKINLDVYKTCYDDWLADTADLRAIAPDFLDMACIQSVVVSFYLLIVYISNIQCDDDVKEAYIGKKKFLEYVEVISQSLAVINQIQLLTQNNELFTEGVKINEFGIFMEVMSCFADLLCKTVGDSKKAYELVSKYWSKKNKKEDDLDILWENLENLEETKFSR